MHRHQVITYIYLHILYSYLYASDFLLRVERISWLNEYDGYYEIACMCNFRAEVLFQTLKMVALQSLQLPVGIFLTSVNHQNAVWRRNFFSYKAV
jgi:hypothetical protein